MKYSILTATITFAMASMVITPDQANADAVKMHPIKQVCVDYEMKGQMMNGTSTRCHRKYGYEQYELQNMKVGFGGFTQSQNQHVITVGDTIYSVDLATKTATKTKNPYYDQIRAAVERERAANLTREMTKSLGYQPKNEKKTISGLSCEVYTSSQLGDVCLTGDGLLLEQAFMGNVQRAVKVRMDDAGDVALYKMPEGVTVSDGPDLSGGLEGIMEQLNQQ